MRYRRQQPVEKAKDFRGAMWRLFLYVGAERFFMLLAAFVAVAAGGLGALAPRVLGTATDEIFEGVTRTLRGEGGLNFDALVGILLVMLVLHSVNIGFNYLQGYIMAGVGMRITFRLREELSAKIHRLPFRFFDKNAHGDVLSRITNDVDTISNTLTAGLSTALMSAVQVAGIVIMMLTISPVLTLAAMMILPLSGICMGLIVKKSQKHFKAQQENLGKLSGHIEEMFTSHAIVKSFGGEEASVEAFDAHNEALYRASWKANFLSGLMLPVIGFISNIGYVAIVVIGGALTLNGRLTLGGIQAFIQYTRQFGHPVSQLASVAAVFQQTAAAAERVFAFLSEDEEAEAESNYGGQGGLSPCGGIGGSAPKVFGRVSFENVNFGYDPAIPVIKNFSAEIMPGQRIAIVGETGAGKTTVVKLLMRFYDVCAGRICLDGADITGVSRRELRRHFGMVLQDTWLFSGSIAENIRYGRLDATDAEVREAAQAARAHHFIRTLPDGYDMQINEEADNLSAGQKQLIAIARTILADPDILILDEATSNVDTRTEVQIGRAMNNLMQGRTSFIIAHRLSTIRSADLILVMSGGNIAEQGTHESLLRQGGIYAGLCAAL